MEVDLQAVAAAAADDAGGLDPGLLGDFLAVTVDAAASGRRLRRRELEGYAERGAAAAHAGVALRALVDLYLSASWRLWEQLPTGDAAATRAAALAVLRASDDGVAALVEGFQLARNDLARRQEAERREVFEALLAGGLRAAGVLGRAADLGLDLASPHAVLVAQREGADPGPLIGRVDRALAGRRGDAAPLLSVQDGQLVVVFAAPDEAAADEVVAAGQRRRRDRVAGGRGAGPGGGRGRAGQLRAGPRHPRVRRPAAAGRAGGRQRRAGGLPGAAARPRRRSSS